MKNNMLVSTEVTERDAIAEHFIHRKKLLEIKSRIDNKPPRIMRHVKKKAKKEFEELKNQAEIQRQNQLLLQKLKKIEQDSAKSATLSKPSSASMNRMRIDKLVRIGDENYKILNRIHSTKPHYSARKHEQDYLYNKYLSIQLSENARRIPRTTSFNPIDMFESFTTGKEIKNSRPNTESSNKNGNGRCQRPMSAKQSKQFL